MLTLATLGMVGYGLWSAAAGAADLVVRRVIGVPTDLGLIVLGVVLVVAAALVRVRMPGGVALALGALLGLQALALHAAARVHGEVTLAPQIGRGVFAALLVALAVVGGRREAARRPPPRGGPPPAAS
jgi:hypothetical protein